MGIFPSCCIVWLIMCNQSYSNVGPAIFFMYKFKTATRIRPFLAVGRVLNFCGISHFRIFRTFIQKFIFGERVSISYVLEKPAIYPKIQSNSRRYLIQKFHNTFGIYWKTDKATILRFTRFNVVSAEQTPSFPYTISIPQWKTTLSHSFSHRIIRYGTHPMLL